MTTDELAQITEEGAGRARAWAAAGVSAVILALAIAAGLGSSATSLGPLIAVESVSARLSGGLLALGAIAPLSYALVAGMIASVNPCGFVLLPSYLGYYLSDTDAPASLLQSTLRATAVSGAVTAGFVALFSLAGIATTFAAAALASSLPWIGAAVGAGLVALAGWLAAGRQLSFPMAPGLARHFRSATRRPGLGGYLAYGIAYGLASLGCTLPVFVGVVGTSLQAHGPADAIAQFLLFGLGMGIVITVATFATAWFGDGLIKRIRALGRHVGWVSAAMLWIGGGYVIYYWLTTSRLA